MTTTSDDRTRALDARDRARNAAHAANCALWSAALEQSADARTQAFAARAARDMAEDEWDTRYGDFDDAA